MDKSTKTPKSTEVKGEVLAKHVASGEIICNPCTTTPPPPPVEVDCPAQNCWDGNTPALPIQTVDVPNCDGTTTPTQANTITATYLLNQLNKDTQRVYDNVTATLSGTIALITAGTSVTVDVSSVVATNWVGARYLVDFGMGHTDLGGSPNWDYVKEPDGNYEIKVYRQFVYPEGISFYLVQQFEVTRVGAVVNVNSANPATVNRAITYTQKEVFQNYCEGLPVGSPYLADGTIATINGNLSISYREEETEWLGAGDATDSEFATQIINEIPNGITYTNDTGIKNPQPGLVKSITVTKQAGTIVEVSFDSGGTYPLRLVANGSRTWGQGNSEQLDASAMMFRQIGNGTYDIIWEI